MAHGVPLDQLREQYPNMGDTEIAEKWLKDSEIYTFACVYTNNFSSKDVPTDMGFGSSSAEYAQMMSLRNSKLLYQKPGTTII